MVAACGRLIGGVVLSTRAVCLSVHLQKRKELLDQWREHDTEIKLLQEEKNMQHAILEKYREQVGAGAAWAAQQGMAEGTAPAWVGGGRHGGFCAAARLHESCARLADALLFGGRCVTVPIWPDSGFAGIHASDAGCRRSLLPSTSALLLSPYPLPCA